MCLGHLPLTILMSSRVPRRGRFTKSLWLVLRRSCQTGMLLGEESGGAMGCPCGSSWAICEQRNTLPRNPGEVNVQRRHGLWAQAGWAGRYPSTQGGSLHHPIGSLLVLGLAVEGGCVCHQLGRNSRMCQPHPCAGLGTAQCLVGLDVMETLSSFLLSSLILSAPVILT